MLIEAHDAETGKRFSKEAKELDGSTLEELLSMQLTRQDVTDMIDNLDVSADVKVLLDRIAQATITIGGRSGLDRGESFSRRSFSYSASFRMRVSEP